MKLISKFRLKKTTAPSDILWENLDLTWGEGFLRKLISAVIVFFLMLITFIIIFAAQLKGAVISFLQNTSLKLF